MNCSNRLRAVVLFPILFVTAAARAQSQTDEIGPLPTTLTAGQLQLMPQLSPVAPPEHPQPRSRRRLPRPVLPLPPKKFPIERPFESWVSTNTNSSTANFQMEKYARA